MTRDEFLALALRNPANVAITDALLELALPDAWRGVSSTAPRRTQTLPSVAAA